MPVFHPPTQSVALAEAKILVYVENRRMKDVVVEHFEIGADLEPSQAVIRFPDSEYDAVPVKENQEVEIYVDRHLTGKPVFRGYVAGIETEDIGIGGALCFDGRGHLDDYIYENNFNVEDEETGLVTNSADTRRIVQDGYNDYKRQSISNGNGAVLGIRLSDFPSRYPGEQNLKGTSIGLGIQRLIESVLDGEYRLFVEHNRSKSALRVLKIGSGRSGHTVRGTNTNLRPEEQPHGNANIGTQRKSENAYQVVNRVIGEGRRRKVETCVQLVPLWDAASQQEIINYPQKYTQKTINGKRNPNYDSANDDVGRQYWIPTIDDRWTDANGKTKGSIRHPKIMDSLVQTSPNSNRKEDPFILVRYPGDTSYQVHKDGFSYKDRMLHLTKKFIKREDLIITSGVGEVGGTLSALTLIHTGKVFGDTMDYTEHDYWIKFEPSHAVFSVAFGAIDTLTLDVPVGWTQTEVDDFLTLSDENTYHVYQDFDPRKSSGEGFILKGADGSGFLFGDPATIMQYKSKETDFDSELSGGPYYLVCGQKAVFSISSWSSNVLTLTDPVGITDDEKIWFKHQAGGLWQITESNPVVASGSGGSETITAGDDPEVQYYTIPVSADDNEHQGKLLVLGSTFNPNDHSGEDSYIVFEIKRNVGSKFYCDFNDKQRFNDDGTRRTLSTNWKIIDLLRQELKGTGGTGGANSTYDPGITMTPNEHIGKSLVLGSTFQSGAGFDPFEVHRIISNDENIITLGGIPEDFSSKSINWFIFDNRTTRGVLPYKVLFNFAFESEQRLRFDSGKTTPIEPERVTHFQREEFKWETKKGNVDLGTSGGGFGIVLNFDTPGHEEDVIVESAELQDIALRDLKQSENIPRVINSVLPLMDMHYKIGQLRYDNNKNTGTSIVKIRFNNLIEGGFTEMLALN